MFSYNAAEDPLFVLLHSFLDYIRALRHDCWNFDEFGVDELAFFIPNSFESQGTESLDTVMRFEDICTLEGAVCGSDEVTIRKMYDIGIWNISYELGSLWNDNPELQSLCGDKLNTDWFYEDVDIGDIMEIENELHVADWNVITRDLDYRKLSFWTMSNVVAVIGSVSLIWLLISKYVMWRKQSNRRDETVQLLGESNDHHTTDGDYFARFGCYGSV